MNKPLPTKEEIKKIFETPLLDLVFKAAEVHRQFHDSTEIQVCTLQSIKTGGCSEDCGYCAQSVHNDSQIERTKLMDLEAVLTLAKEAKDNGSTRFCMGSSGRQVRDDADFANILQMVKGVAGQGLEVCCTLGMLNQSQAAQLKEAGLYAYNHNLDTSREHYEKVTTTRKFDDRLETIDNLAKAGVSLCCGGILGIGETEADRMSFLQSLTELDPPPESVPINVLVPIAGTKMQSNERVPTLDLVRVIAAARILLPTSMIRLSAGRESLSPSDQAFCFLSGANSIFSGDKLLTTPGPDADQDASLFAGLNLTPQKPYSRDK